MNMNDITKRFTEIVAGYMTQGYTFSSTMAGHQGEIMKVDLTDGKSVIRVNLEKHCNFGMRWTDEITLTAERFDKPVHEFTTLWTGKGESLLTETFYQISDRRDHSDFYTADLTEVERIEAVRVSRARAARSRSTRSITDPAALKAVLSFVKRQEGCKSKRLSDVKEILRDEKDFTVCLVSGKRYTLH